MKIGTWTEYDWTAGEKPLECYRAKVGRGFICLHLRAAVKFETNSMNGDWIEVPTGKLLWHYTSSFGPNSDNSFSGLVSREPVTLDEAKAYIANVVLPKLF